MVLPVWAHKRNKTYGYVDDGRRRRQRSVELPSAIATASKACDDNTIAFHAGVSSHRAVLLLAVGRHDHAERAGRRRGQLRLGLLRLQGRLRHRRRGLVLSAARRSDHRSDTNDGPDARAFASVNDLAAVSGATPQLRAAHRSADSLAPVRRRQVRDQGRDVARERHQHLPQLQLLRRRSGRRHDLRRLQQLRPRLHRPAVGDLLGADHRRCRRRRTRLVELRGLLRVRDGDRRDRQRAPARHDHHRHARHRRRPPPRRHRRRQDLPPARALVADVRPGRRSRRRRRHHGCTRAGPPENLDAHAGRHLDRRQLRLGLGGRADQPLRRALPRRRHRRRRASRCANPPDRRRRRRARRARR